MAKVINWTPSQRAAIDAKANKILVSAAAGSGKSTVLTKRIIDAVTVQNPPHSLSRLMVVTFTRASADDLRGKITAAVQSAVLESPDDPRLREQLLQLPAARINTIHGICYSLVKKHFEALSLPASVSIADDTILTAMKIDVMKRLIDHCYSGAFEAITDFADFAENFVAERDDDLVDFFLSLYSSMKNHPDGFSRAILDNYALNGKKLLDTPYGDIIISRLRLLCDYFKRQHEQAIRYFSSEPAYSKLIDPFRDEILLIDQIDTAAKNKEKDTLASLISNTPKFPTVRILNNNKTAEGEEYRDRLKEFRVKAQTLFSSIFNFTDEEIERTARVTRDIADNLLSFLTEYDKRFTEAKHKRSLIDFNDIEHYTLKLLYNEDGSISALAKELSSSLDEIYVDEYQDLNPLQNKIFEALSVNCPIFMVGDIKQSIYGFRGADSGAFSKYKKTFPEYDGTNTQENATIFLSDNFRSLEPITDFANAVSDAMFYNPSNESLYDYRIPYEKGDRLRANAKAEITPKVTVMNCIRDMSDEVIKLRGTYYVEAEMVANEIQTLISNGVKTSEIAILLRGTKENAKVYERSLKARGIKVSSGKAITLFECPEIQLALSLLNCCDNPYRDIFLTGALRSPIFGITMDELVQIKKYALDTTSLYAALLKYTEETNFVKGQKFLDFLTKMRKYAINNTVDKLLWQIYTETAYFSVIYDMGRISENEAYARRANLIKLHDIAKSYTASGQNDLYGFLEKIRIMIEQDKSPDASTTESDGVTITSMHSSKGLEFNYCFLGAMSSKFVTSDVSSNTIFNQSIGIAMRVKDEARLTTSDTPFRLALAYQKELMLCEEEMRILYVALTRAKLKLYVCSSVKDPSILKEQSKINAKIMHPYTFLRLNNFISWILTALNMPTDISPEFEYVDYTQEQILSFKLENSTVKPENESAKSMTDEEIEDEKHRLKDILTFNYPHKTALKLPSKLSVSRLYPEILDEPAYLGVEDVLTPDGDLTLDSDGSSSVKRSSALAVPSFMLDEKTVTAAEKGTATHVFMQFCSFDNLNGDIEKEIDRLVDKRFILPQHASIINRNAVKRFAESDIFKEINASNDVQREYRFNIKLPASEFTSNPELKEKLESEYVFVQGIIDCYFRDKNGDIILLDYKTDFVPSEIRGDPQLENSFFTDRHAKQLRYYKEALKILTGKDVKRTVIYSFSLAKTIEIDI